MKHELICLTRQKLSEMLRATELSLRIRAEDSPGVRGDLLDTEHRMNSGSWWA
jgi:hypothetical protein